MKLGSEETPAVHQIPQVVNPGQRASSELLPSFIYLAAGSEFSGALDVPWATDRRFVMGQFARAHEQSSQSTRRIGEVGAPRWR